MTAGAAWLTGLIAGGVALLAAGAAAWTGLASSRGLWRGRRALTARLRAEEVRVAAFQEAQRRQLEARQQEHARQIRAWRRRDTAFRRQPQWYPVTLPTSVHRVDVAGGTLAGWSALLTMIAAPRLAAGGEVTVLDLTEGGVATDLLAVARRSGIAPLVSVLPADLPRLELGTQLSAEVLADVLAQTVSATVAATHGSAARPDLDDEPGRSCARRGPARRRAPCAPRRRRRRAVAGLPGCPCNS